MFGKYKNVLYLLVDPNSHEIRYVGVTTQGMRKRFNGHMSNGELSRVNLKSNWIKSLVRKGQKPVVKIFQEFEQISRENLKELEIYWIKYFRNNDCPLTNATDGGDGLTNPSEYTREKLRINALGNQYGLGYKHTEEHKKLISENWRGRRHTEESKKLMSKIHTGKIVSEDTKAKISDALVGNKYRKGIPHTEEDKEKISTSLITRWQDPSFVEKMSKRKPRPPLSDKERKAASDRKTAYWANKSTEDRKAQMRKARAGMRRNSSVY